MTPEQQMINKFLSYQEISGAKHLKAMGEQFPDLFELCADSHLVGALQYLVAAAILY